MSEYAVIVQNDESKWDDIKGDLYQYPSTYKAILTPGCKIIYYKGKMVNRAFSSQRLTPEPHYFGCGLIGDSILASDSKRGERYCEILEYQEFEKPVLSKLDGKYLEPIPESKKSNYWRFGVREISRVTYDTILSRATILGAHITLPNSSLEFESFQPIEGNKRARFTSYYERNPFYRSRAIEIHGVSCMVCDFNFEKCFGELGKGYIHVHHNKPVSESGPTKINPFTDMSVVCPNCHAMIHKRKDTTLSVQELRDILKAKAFR